MAYFFSECNLADVMIVRAGVAVILYKNKILNQAELIVGRTSKVCDLETPGAVRMTFIVAHSGVITKPVNLKVLVEFCPFVGFSSSPAERDWVPSVTTVAVNLIAELSSLE